jgi:hypothetical protein
MGPRVRGDDACGFEFQTATFVDTASRSRRLFRASFILNFPPSPIRGRRECRTLGASAAACAVVESTRVSHHGHAGNVRHSPRNGFNGFLRALPGDRACLPPSPLRSLLLGSLMPASGHQDHTTSPSAGPRARQQRGSRPPHPAPTFVTMANAPLRDRTGQVLKVIWGSCEGKYFFKRDWTRDQPTTVICPSSGKSHRSAARVEADLSAVDRGAKAEPAVSRHDRSCIPIQNNKYRDFAQKYQMTKRTVSE